MGVNKGGGLDPRMCTCPARASAHRLSRSPQFRRPAPRQRRRTRGSRSPPCLSRPATLLYTPLSGEFGELLKRVWVPTGKKVQRSSAPAYNATGTLKRRVITRVARIPKTGIIIGWRKINKKPSPCLSARKTAISENCCIFLLLLLHWPGALQSAAVTYAKLVRMRMRSPAGALCIVCGQTTLTQ